MEVLILVPGAVTAGTKISFPSYAPPASKLAYVAVVSLVEGTPNTFSLSAKTITTGTPSSGEAALSGTDGIVLGDDVTASDLVIVVYVKKGEYSGA